MGLSRLPPQRKEADGANPGAGPGADAPAGPAVVRRARAKINLYLHVTGRRQDGYHLLDSLVVFAAEAADEIHARRAAVDFSLVLEGPFAGPLHDETQNLVLRAARSLATLRLGRGAGNMGAAELTLVKNLPVAAGLGGGSADAAATLRALRELWNFDAADEDLARLAASLGADVPVCLAGEPARLCGIGDVIEPVPGLPDLWLVLANPGVAVSTAEVYAGLAPGHFSPPQPLAANGAEMPKTAEELARALGTRRNDLEAPARLLAPQIGEVLDALGAQPDCLIARMSGSGATCFGLFADDGAARKAASAMAAAQPGWWLQVTAAGTSGS